MIRVNRLKCCTNFAVMIESSRFEQSIFSIMIRTFLWWCKRAVLLLPLDTSYRDSTDSHSVEGSWCGVSEKILSSRGVYRIWVIICEVVIPEDIASPRDEVLGDVTVRLRVLPCDAARWGACDVDNGKRDWN